MRKRKKNRQRERETDRDREIETDRDRANGGRWILINYTKLKLDSFAQQEKTPLAPFENMSQAETLVIFKQIRQVAMTNGLSARRKVCKRRKLFKFHETLT